LRFWPTPAAAVDREAIDLNLSFVIPGRREAPSPESITPVPAMAF
jgi:hypothetical protein